MNRHWPAELTNSLEALEDRYDDFDDAPTIGKIKPPSPRLGNFRFTPRTRRSIAAGGNRFRPADPSYLAMPDQGTQLAQEGQIASDDLAEIYIEEAIEHLRDIRLMQLAQKAGGTVLRLH